MKDYKICVYAICKNESKFVKEWLDSMQEADYIVVMDTGSTDNTVKLLQNDKRVTKVEVNPIKPWRFDVARNESMKLIPDDADILVCTDLDEKFRPGWAKILRENWSDDITRCFYTYAWSHSDSGAPQDVFKYDKIHNRDYTWKYPVHEVLIMDDDKIEKAIDVGEKIYLDHYPDKDKSRTDYFDLLKLSVDENPDDSHVAMLLAREYLVRGDNSKGLEEFLKVLEMPDINVHEKRLVLLASLLQVACCYEEDKNYDEALWYCQEFIKEDYTYRDPYIVMAALYNSMEMPTLAEASLEAANKYAYQHYDWVERSSTWTSWYDDEMSIAQFKLNNYALAIEYVNKALKFAPDDTRMLKNLAAYLTEYNKEINNKLAKQNLISQ